jgi:uncharacterized protein YwgA
MTPSRVSLLLAVLTEKLRAHDSWAGETHLQKAVYFLQTMLGVPTGFKFTLYKYGPFSFDLRDKLTEMRGSGQLELLVQPAPYGPQLQVGPGADQLRKRFPKTLRGHEPRLEFIAGRLGGLGVGALERLATALLVTEEAPEATVEERAEQLHAYKPHVKLDAARRAVEQVDKMVEEARELGLFLER